MRNGGTPPQGQRSTTVIEDPSPPQDRADRVAERLSLPVLVAALASIPAVFLTLFDDPWATVGNGLNAVSGVVLVAETLVLFAVADDRRAWAGRHRWLIGLAIAIVPAVLFAVGPVQLLRLARVAGALRILRVGRILKAGRILRERTGLDHGWQRSITILATVLCAAFVAIVLADPSSSSRGVVDRAVELVGVPGVVLAGLLLGGATWLAVSDRITLRRDRDRSASWQDTPSGAREHGQESDPPG